VWNNLLKFYVSLKTLTVGWCFLKEEISRRDFLFLFETEGKKDTFETRIIIIFRRERARALKEHRHTRTHKTREREKDDAFFFSDIYSLLFVYFVFVLFARTTEREKEREDILSSPLIKERENIEIIKERRRHHTSSCF
jgi:hypothetical protein